MELKHTLSLAEREVTKLQEVMDQAFAIIKSMYQEILDKNKAE